MKQETYEFLKAAMTDRAVFNANMEHYRILSKVSDAIAEAWEVWDDCVTKTYYEGGTKPERRPDSFAESWIDNNDFAADGFDEDELDSIVPAYYFK